MKRELQKRKKEKLKVDKSFKLTMLFLLLVVFFYAQKKEISYEQVALNYFIKEVVPDKFPNIKYIISNKKIENEKSDDYLFCYYFKNNKGNQIIEKKKILL